MIFFAIDQLVTPWVTQARPNSGTLQEGGGRSVRTNLDGGSTRNVSAGNSIRNRRQLMTQARSNSGTQRGQGCVYDRNVRINHDSAAIQNVPAGSLLRRSPRVKTPVKLFNVGELKCFVCRKTFRQDLTIEHYTGNIACSFACFKKV